MDSRQLNTTHTGLSNLLGIVSRMNKVKVCKEAISGIVITAISVQLGFSSFGVNVLAAELATETTNTELKNTNLPLTQPAPSGLVKKIWNSIDLRKNKLVEPDIVKADDKASKIVQDVDIKEKLKSNSSTQLLSDDLSKKSDDLSKKDDKVENTSVANKDELKQVEISKSTEAEKTKVEEVSTEITKNDETIKIASNLVSLPPGSILSRVQEQNEALVVDNDEAEQVEETIKYEELATDEGKTHAKAGARFPVVISSQISSKTAKKGDPIQARLKYDLKIGNRLIAQKGSMVNGHVNYCLKARTILHSLVSPERWYRNSGCIGIDFDEIVNERGEHLPLKAQPLRQARIVKNKGEGRELGVNHYGQITGPWAQQIRYKAVRIGLNAALAPVGAFSFGAMPVALGVMGAVNPSFAFARPVGLNVRHRRLKGFAWGFLSGIPGSWLIEDTTVKGQEAIIKPGDEFYAELVQEFTGEPASDAQLMPGASTKLHGEVLTDTKSSKKKKK